VLIERVIRGLSAAPDRDQQATIRLATTARDQMRRWSGPSENAHRLLVQERMLAQGFAEVIALATPVAFGGHALDREAVDPVVAIAGAQASIALGDHVRAARFADALRGTPTEPLLRAIAAGPRPRHEAVALWRTALGSVDTALGARACLHQLAASGALEPTDLTRVADLANLDDRDRVLFTARNAAAAGDLAAAVTLLRSQPSPAAGELLAQLLHDAGRSAEAVAVCNDNWRTYRTLKALQDKVNILAESGDLDGADACAVDLLATGELPIEQRRQLHHKLIARRAGPADWPGVEDRCRAALREHPGDADFIWGLIIAQLNQDRWQPAWASYTQLRPEIHHRGVVRPWVELHLRFDTTPQSRVAAAALTERFSGDPDALTQLRRLDDAPS
jgi:hypothetical protein